MTVFSFWTVLGGEGYYETTVCKCWKCPRDSFELRYLLMAVTVALCYQNRPASSSKQTLAIAKRSCCSEYCSLNSEKSALHRAGYCCKRSEGLQRLPRSIHELMKWSFRSRGRTRRNSTPAAESIMKIKGLSYWERRVEMVSTLSGPTLGEL